eukprot:366220-Chlamydomonas_euryale.AAC.2
MSTASDELYIARVIRRIQYTRSRNASNDKFTKAAETGLVELTQGRPEHYTRWACFRAPTCVGMYVCPPHLQPRRLFSTCGARWRSHLS